jgi:hypothetical protein
MYRDVVRNNDLPAALNTLLEFDRYGLLDP